VVRALIVRSRALILVTIACAALSAACGGVGTLTGGGGTGGAGALPGRGGVSGGGGVTGSGAITGRAGAEWYRERDQFCATVFSPRELPPRVLVVLDASHSMNDDTHAVACSGGCGQSSKWAVAVAAINAMAAETGNHVLWGLELFGTEGTDVCGTSTGVAVEPLPGSSPSVALALINQSTPKGGVTGGPTRNTRGAVDAAATYLFAQRDPNAMVIALMTDGAPSCASGGTPASDDTPATVAAIGRSLEAGAGTMVIGIATAGGPADDSLKKMGAAGALGPGYGYLAASSVAELSEALRLVVDAAGVCTFEVPSPAPFADRSKTMVYLGGTEVLRDQTHTAGWDFADGSFATVRLFGPPCDAVKSAQTSSVTIRFACLAF
jgi:hypothetical protein